MVGGRVMPNKISVNNKSYKVLENLGYNPDVGLYVKEIETPEGPKIAVGPRGGPWRFLDSQGPHVEWTQE